MPRFNLEPTLRRFGRARPASLGIAAVAAVLLAGLAGPGPAAATITTSFDESTGTLRFASDADDDFEVGCDNGGVFLNVPGEATIPCNAVRTLIVDGGPGSNTIDVSGVTPAEFATLATVELSGGGGLDLITGSALADQLDGGEDSDGLIGAGGDDTVRGGNDNDSLQWFEGDGSDTIEGDAGSDVVIVAGSAEAGDAIEVAASGERARVQRTNLTPFTLDAGTV
jgi:Ca2+-binding RTX toxin-like protein